MKNSKKILLSSLLGGTLVLASCASSKMCGSSELSHGQFCFSDTVHDRCGGDLVYDPASQICSDGSLLPKCGSDTYNPSTHYCKSGTTLTAYSTFTDNRDGKTYKYTTIGNQVWMAENLNYNASNSACYGLDNSNCDKYGRLYDWNTAMNVCPEGWRLPSDKEWETLINYVGKETAETKLKATYGYRLQPASLLSKNYNYKGSYNGTDDYGFSALPGGRIVDPRSVGGQAIQAQASSFDGVGTEGCWWSATSHNGNPRFAITWGTLVAMCRVNYDKVNSISVRCIANESTAQQLKAEQ